MHILTDLPQSLDYNILADAAGAADYVQGESQGGREREMREVEGEFLAMGNGRMEAATWGGERRLLLKGEIEKLQ